MIYVKDDTFDLADEFGPEKVVHVYDPLTGLKGFTVIHNTALGPAKGGIRMTPSVSVEEVYRLAETMTWKCSLAELPFGGGKSGIIANPHDFDKSKKMKLMKVFGRSLQNLSPSEYVAAPDVNTAEEEMRSFVSGNGDLHSATGKPGNLCVGPGEKCGIPHEYGSTGFGVAHSTKIAAKEAGIKLKGASVAIEGFGNVGTFAMKHLTDMGAKIVAVSDSKGVIHNEEGLDFEKLKSVKKTEGTVVKYEDGEKLDNKDLFELDVDILIPAALPDVINEKNYKKIKAKVVVEAANIPTTPEIEEKLHERNILVVPDFVANAGGVISSYAEFAGKNPEDMFKLVKEKITKSTRKVLKKAEKDKISPRDAAMEIAVSRVKKAMEERDKELSD